MKSNESNRIFFSQLISNRVASAVLFIHYRTFLLSLLNHFSLHRLRRHVDFQMSLLNRFVFLLLIFISFSFVDIQCQITTDFEHILSNQLDYLAVKHLPAVFHNDEVFLSVIYKCSIGTKRRISLEIRIEQNLYRTNFAVFRRHWFCFGSKHIRLRYIPIRLHRSLAFASDSQSNLQSWPIENGRLTLTMFKSIESNLVDMIKIVRHDVKFLPVHQRPSFYSYPWQPLGKSVENTCAFEAEVVRLVDYPLVMTGSSHGKHVQLPHYHDYSLRLDQQIRASRPKFSILIWLYVDEYCPTNSNAMFCGILQHLNFNNTHFTPELFFTREGQIMVNMFGHLYDHVGTGARTLASVPKNDWCRIVFVADEFKWSIFVNCLENWTKPIIASHTSPIYFYSFDILNTLIVGGSELNPSFRGLINRIDFYRRVALRYDQLPKKFDESFKLNFPFINEKATECLKSERIFRDSFDEFRRYVDFVRFRSTCSADVYRRKSIRRHQCSPIRSWKNALNISMSSDIRYRIFRGFLHQKVNSTIDVGRKLFEISTKLLEIDDPQHTCHRLVTWLKHSSCYEYPPSFSLLATFYQFGLCNLTKSNRKALDYLFAGAFRNDRLSLLALAHRHFYGLDDVPLDYDAAYLYYRQMAEKAREEFYDPIPGEASIDLVRLTDEKLLNELTFDKSETFYWLKQQALRGVASAQQHLGALMYAGSHGLTRNIQAAVEYFRLGAEQHDAWSHFGYGLALMTGQGTKQNMTAAIQHLEKAVEHGYAGAQVALGFHAYENEKNYTKAAKYWQQCFDETYDQHCAHNLGVMWTAGRYPPEMTIDHGRAWQYYSFAAQRGQIDSKIVVAQYNARTGHPKISRNPWLSALWARHTAEESSALGTIVRRGIEAFRDHRWQTSFIYYLQAAAAGAEIGYFNSGYLCHELQIRYETTFDCIEQLLSMSILTRPNELYLDSYALITVADYSQWIKRNLTQAMSLYLDLYQHGDPQGLYSLAQMEEFETNLTIPMKIWHRIGVIFDNQSLNSRYRKLQTIYQHCRTLKTKKSAEAFVPCTLAYLRVSLMILIEEQTKIFMTSFIVIISTVFVFVRFW